MSLTYQQARLVKGTLPALREHGERITSIFYSRMLRDHPELHDYFNTVNQQNGSQPRALTAIILGFAANISQTSELIPRLERVCHKHCSLGIKPEHYEIVGQYLIQAFREVLGPAMTPEVQAAWTKAYWVLAKMMTGREMQLYQSFRPWDGFRRFKVDRKVAESEDVCSFYLVPADGRPLPSYLPGQYVSLRISAPETGYLQSRQYSLSERPRHEFYRVSVKRDSGTRYANSVSASYFNPGVVSNWLIDNLQTGGTVEVSHPAGEFFLDTNNGSSVPLVLISAGIGVAPMIAILDTVAEAQPGRELSFIHASRGAAPAPFEDHVRDLARRRCQRLRTAFFKTGSSDGRGSRAGGGGGGGGHRSSGESGDGGDYEGRMDLSRISPEDLFLRHGGTEYFICGPEQFMADMAEYLKLQGVDLHRVKFELFSTGDVAFKPT